MATKKKPTDSTLRNVRAANTKIASLTKRIQKLEAWKKAISPDVEYLKKYFRRVLSRTEV